MKGTVLITGQNNDFDMYLAKIFEREGYEVFALKHLNGLQAMMAEVREKAGKLDFLLDTTDYTHKGDSFTIIDGIDGNIVEDVFRKNVLASMAILEAVLPLMDAGVSKRLFYLTRASASINETQSTSQFGYNMSKAALHQFIQMARNKLASGGYTFRVFDPLHGVVSPEAAAESAYHYITRRRGTENHDPLRDDEEILVFRDADGRQHTW